MQRPAQLFAKACDPRNVRAPALKVTSIKARPRFRSQAQAAEYGLPRFELALGQIQQSEAEQAFAPLDLSSRSRKSCGFYPNSVCPVSMVARGQCRDGELEERAGDAGLVPVSRWSSRQSSFSARAAASSPCAQANLRNAGMQRYHTFSSGGFPAGRLDLGASAGERPN
ncbi:MAG: hypothetical protein U1F41_02540 [Burkholderiales bacterium]